ncbi:MAG: hypothetical protein LC713_07040, partial [Actinobacteria bacterium]|nr:hypothetical protein [Actinomycetota bacterium]
MSEGGGASGGATTSARSTGASAATPKDAARLVDRGARGDLAAPLALRAPAFFVPTFFVPAFCVPALPDAFTVFLAAATASAMGVPADAAVAFFVADFLVAPV